RCPHRHRGHQTPLTRTDRGGAVPALAAGAPLLLPRYRLQIAPDACASLMLVPSRLAHAERHATPVGTDRRQSMLRACRHARNMAEPGSPPGWERPSGICFVWCMFVVPVMSADCPYQHAAVGVMRTSSDGDQRDPPRKLRRQ